MQTLTALTAASIILLCLEAMILVLIPGIIFYFLARGVTILIAKLRTWSPLVQGYFRQAATITEQVSHMVVAPVIIVNEKSEQVRGSGAALAAMIRRRKEV
jgi:hypothetical protein